MFTPKIETQWAPRKSEEEEPVKKEERPDRLPKIETQWVPRKTSRSEEQAPLKQEEHPHKLRHLLAALSFEHLPNLPEVLKKKKKKKWKKIKRKTRPSPIDTGNNLTHGTRTDSDGSDVYFDAAEFGDLGQDSFKLRGAARESVVLTDIQVAHVLDDGAVETVLGSQDQSSQDHSSSSDEEFEYSEHDYQSTCESGGDELYFRGESATMSTSSSADDSLPRQHIGGGPRMGPPPPKSLPLRFLRAGKNDPVEGLRRYEATLQMRKAEKVDTILRESNPKFELIKKNYPHFCHMTGKNGEPVFYEQPPKTNLKALRAGGVTLDKLLRHFLFICEYQWQYLERDDLATSIYVIDLEGMRMGDFVGECVDFVKRASAISAQHYPERAGYVFVINVPAWFKMVWNVIKPIVDEDTQKKVYILRGKDEIRTMMQERISLENLPPEYGGNSMPLGQSPEEKQLAALLAHNNDLAEKGISVCQNDCKFCNWVPARSY